MTVINTLRKFKRKAISPVIAAVLLIGLVVVGGALLAFMVLPLLNPAPEFEINTPYLVYDAEATKNYNEGIGKIEFRVIQTGPASVEISSIEVFYTENTASDPEGTKIDLTTDGVSLQPAVSSSTPQKATTTGTLFTVRFKLPAKSGEEGIQLRYRVKVTESKGGTESTDFNEQSMLMRSDKPTIDLSSLSAQIRGTNTPLIASVFDEYGGAASVTYTIENLATGMNYTSETVSSGTFMWQWNTRLLNGSTPLYPNGTYRVYAEVKDYAGWSDQAQKDVEIDNDYTPPTILSASIIAPYSNQTGERGEDIVIETEAIDTGCKYINTTVAGVYIHYKYNVSGALEKPLVTMSPVAGRANFYQGRIPSTFVNHDAIAKNITYYIEAVDSFDNKSYSSSPNNGTKIRVFDLRKPDYDVHDIVTTALENSGINITAIVTDTDEAANFTTLYWRKTADTVYTSAPETVWQKVNMTLVNATTHVFQHTISSVYVTLDGIEYMMNASDDYGNTLIAGPYKVNVPDKAKPYIAAHIEPSGVIEGTDLDLTIVISDNDQTFDDPSYLTGKVEIFYRIEVGAYEPVPVVMDYMGSGLWLGTILGGNFSSSNVHGFDYYIRVTDNSSNVAFEADDPTQYLISPHNVPIRPSGTPFIDRASEVTLLQTGLYTDDTIKFTIKNRGTELGSITHLNVSFLGSMTPGLGIDRIIINGQRWTGTWYGSGWPMDLSPDVDLAKDAAEDLELRFNNTVDIGTYEFNFTVTYSGGTVYNIITVDIAEATPDYSIAYSTHWLSGGDRTLNVRIQSTGDTMTVNKIRVTFSGSITVNSIEVPIGTTVWNAGNGASGNWFDFTPGTYYTWNGGGTIDISIRFSGRIVSFFNPTNNIIIDFMTDNGYEVNLPQFTVSYF
ncbi:MAG: archaellin/type IV pilin N-terminal domain-containing protein [Candidatus Odinarchaeota archaeon]